MKTAAIVLAILAVICLSIWAEISVWMECRQTHTFLYCWRTIP